MANVFQEGEPLDVTQLNQMYTDIVKLQAVFGSMTSAGSIVGNLLGPTVPVIDLGYIPAVTIGAGKVATIDISTLLAKKFTGVGTPMVTITPFTELSAKDSISASLAGSGLDKIIYITNNGTTSQKVGITWHAIFLKPIPAL